MFRKIREQNTSNQNTLEKKKTLIQRIKRTKNFTFYDYNFNKIKSV